MKAVNPSYEIMTPIDGESILRHLEKAIRVCYKSEGMVNEDSHYRILKKIINSKHFSTIEHFSVTVRFVCNRGFSHELVRHRISSFSQESTRYCNYSKDKFGGELTVIIPPTYEDMSSQAKAHWQEAMVNAEVSYNKLIESGEKAGMARGVLPLDVKTEIICTSNLRQWVTILSQRCPNNAHKSMQQLMRPLLAEFQAMIPILFDDIKY